MATAEEKLFAAAGNPLAPDTNLTEQLQQSYQTRSQLGIDGATAADGNDELSAASPTAPTAPMKQRTGAMYERTAILVKDTGIQKLQATNVFLCGVGGVGGHCAEALVRAGIGAITLCDHDVVTATNKNRQLVALDTTVGQCKVDILAARLNDINAACKVTAMDAFVLPEDVELLLKRQRYDFVVDCIDSVECKVALLAGAVELGLTVFSSGGAGGRLDPSLAKTGDLFETENDALLRACRGQLRRRGIGLGKITCVYSTEKALPPLAPVKQESGGRDRGINGTISYMPPMFGLHLASMTIRAALDHEGHRAALAKKVKRKEAQAKRDAFAAEAKAKARGEQKDGDNTAAAASAKKGKKGQKQPPKDGQSGKRPHEAKEADGNVPPSKGHLVEAS